MKTRSYLCHVLLFSLLCLATISQAAEIIFRPAPGLNDGTDTGTATAGKDAQGGQCDNPGANYGSSESLYSAPQTTCNSCNTSTWLRFDVSTLPSDVTKVYLGFTHRAHPQSYCDGNCNADFYFYPVTSDWGEMTVSRATPPTRGSAVFGPVNIVFPNDLGNKEYEITDLYRQWKSGAIANHGIEISSPTSGCNNASVAFHTYSSDAATESQRPYLRVVTPDTTTTPATETTIFDNNNVSSVSNGPTSATTFTVETPAQITYILTYHWNGGSGSPGGTISLKHSDGTVYGPWTATTTLSGTRYWEVRPAVTIKAGTYTVQDSSPSTWSYNSASGNAGIAIVKGIPGSAPSVAFDVTATASGGDSNLTLSAAMTMASEHVGKRGEVYLAANLGSSWFFNNGAGWNTPLAPYFSGMLPATMNIPVVSGMNLSSLGGLGIYAGYGTDVMDMVNSSRYKNIYTVAATPGGTSTAVPSGFVAGTGETYTLAGGQSFSETLSGATMTPPASASGSLTVRPVSSAPWLPSGAQAFVISAGAAEYVDIAVAHGPGSEVQLRVWGTRRADGKPSAMGWIYVLAHADDGATATFRIPLSSTTVAATNSASFARAREDDFGVAVVIPTKEQIAAQQATLAQQKAAIGSQVEAVLDDLLTRLPSTLASSVRARMLAFPATIIPGISGFDCRDEDGSAYVPYFETWAGYLGVSKKGMLEFCGFNTDTAYHEIGHYLHHLIADDAPYRSIARNSLNYGAEHVIGQMFDRKSLIEDYAYLFEMLAGRGKTIAGEWGAGFNGAPFSSAYTQLPRPSRDYPASEGFFSSLVGALAYAPGGSERTVTLPHQLDGTSSNVRESVPVIGIGWGPVLEIIVAGGIASANKLWELSAPAFGEAKFAVLAERYGWSYFAHGKVMNGTTPVAGVTVEPTCSVDTSNFITPSATTDATGTFKLARVFPGKACKLNITTPDGKTVSADYAIDPTLATSTDIDLGTFQASIILVTISPADVTLSPGATQNFRATITGTPNTAVTWSVLPGGGVGGTITSNGVYTAPVTGGTYHVVATSQADPTQGASATVTVSQPLISGFQLSWQAYSTIGPQATDTKYFGVDVCGTPTELRCDDTALTGRLVLSGASFHGYYLYGEAKDTDCTGTINDSAVTMSCTITPVVTTADVLKFTISGTLDAQKSITNLSTTGSYTKSGTTTSRLMAVQTLKFY